VRRIDGNVFSHIRFTETIYPDEPDLEEELETQTVERPEWCSVPKVRASGGYTVRSFRALVSLVAELGYRNRRYNLLFRGQQQDYLDRNGRSAIYPSIFRPKPGQKHLRKTAIAERFDALTKAIALLRKEKSALGAGWPGLYLLREYQMALLQHYGVRKTPLTDATHSLRVATSFALPDRTATEGFVLVLGMPHPSGSISHFVDDDIVLVKLQNVCPPSALRPHYQEGYLLGRLSLTCSKERGDNAAYRLIAKYHLKNEDGSFWDDDFRPIPPTALYPADDPFEQKMLDLLGPDQVP